MKTAERQWLRRIASVVLVAVLVACSWLAPLDSAANAQVDAGLKRALITFATARALNAVISVVQGTELAIEPAGVGLVLTPGQVLNPINDLVEQFSNLMLIASVSFGVQKVLIDIGAHWVVSLLLSAAALGWAMFLLRQEPAPAWLSRLLVVLLMTRFAVPAVTIGADGLFRVFMAADYQSSQQLIDTASGNLVKSAPLAAAANENRGILETIKGWWPQPGELKARFEHLKQVAEKAVEHIIRLMVIFLLQTLLLPLLLLWVLYSVARRIFERPFRMPQAASMHS